MSQFPPPPRQPGYPTPPPPQQQPGYPPAPQPPYPGYTPPQGMPQASQTNGLAIGSFICGLVGCFAITPLIGLILGFLGLKDAGKKGGSGRGLAIAGILLSLLWIGGFGLGAFFTMKFIKAAEPAKQVADAFAKDLAAGNVDAAKARCTSSITREEIAAASDKLKGLGTVSNTMMFGASVNAKPGSTVWILGGAVTAGGQGVPYQVKIVDENGTLKLDGFMLTIGNRPVSGGTPTNNPTAGQ